jgi:hypothetical protein
VVDSWCEARPEQRLGFNSTTRFANCKQGGHRFDPSHVPQNFTPVLSAIYSATSPSDFTEFFWGALGAITISGRSEAVADGLGLCEAHIYFLGEMRL